MLQLTVRGLEPELVQRLKGRAKETRQSLNKAVVELLRVGLGLRLPRKRYHDLDALAGTWSKEEEKQFSASLKKQRRVDPESWQ